MDAKFQASFIPKQPAALQEPGKTSYINLFSLIAIIIFILTLGLGGGMAIAKHMLTKRIADLDQTLVQARASFELSTIEELKRTANRINQAKNLLGKHISFSKFFEALEQSTYKTVAWTQFSYEFLGSSVEIKLAGIASSFNTLSLQADILRELRFLSGQTFENFSLTKEGRITFDFTARVDQSFVSYGSRIEAVTDNLE